LHSSVTFETLRVLRTSTTTNPASSSNGAITVYCEASDGTKITVRTAVLYREDGALVTADLFEGKTLASVKGIIDYYDPDSGEEEDDGDFHYQIKVLSLGDISIQGS